MPFDASSLVYFRQRFTPEMIDAINERIATQGKVSKFSKKKLKLSSIKLNHGKLLIDATVAPCDIKYPTDVGLLNKGREITEKVIDYFHSHLMELD